ncbi:MAG TPA: ABC transporter ATP-binding protein, partial [Euryarchaeota archaeon]|nr:ABC transporter ATP-binding protein [Euryarchaeota archaeon]
MYACEADSGSGAIHIERLTKDYGFVRAVDNLTLDVRRGTTVGFLGPNGAGKSTTIKILTNLITATDGFAFLNGVDVTKKPKLALADVGSVVETPEFYPYLTPRETLSYIGKLRGLSTKDITDRSKELLDLVKLEEWKDQRIGKFSKGMKQRLAIAQALLHEPQILILDEPTSGLDPRGMVEVREILQALKSDCYTIFMSSHLLAEVQEICDHVALIDHGKLLQYDTVENLSNMARTNVIGIDLAEAPPEGIVDQLGRLENVGRVQLVSPLRILIEYTG